MPLAIATVPPDNPHRIVCDSCKRAAVVTVGDAETLPGNYADASLYLCHECEVLLWQQLATRQEPKLAENLGAIISAFQNAGTSVLTPDELPVRFELRDGSLYATDAGTE